MTKSIALLCFFLSGGLANASPSAPSDPIHPGSKIYNFNFSKEEIRCSGRKVEIYLPTPRPSTATTMIVFGHGQALNSSHYEESLEHVARKGFIAIHPQYDNGFFDQNWNRMASDYLNQTRCAVDHLGTLAASQKVIFSGHSKGAYVASIAAGLASQHASRIVPAAVLLFGLAGFDASSATRIATETELTVVFGEEDSIVSEDFSRQLYNQASATRRQFIKVKSYPAENGQRAVSANHMFPLTKASTFGGGEEGPLHYYGVWKWLVAAANDVEEGARGTQEYLYGSKADDKGVEKLKDTVQRNFTVTENADYLVYLRDHADLTEVTLISDRKAKGKAVHKILVDHAQRSQSKLVRRLNERGMTFQPFYVDNVILVQNVSQDFLKELKADADVARVVPNLQVKLSTPNIEIPTGFSERTSQSNIELVHADRVWSELNIFGDGITIGGQDTGYDWTHPALRSHYRGAAANGTVDHNYNWHDAIRSGQASRCGVSSPVPCDDTGHGTHTMGSMVGDDGGENKIGVAPHAKWIGCRNMINGVGTPASYLECFEFFLAPYPLNGDARRDGRSELAPDIINNSWACPASEGCSGQEFIGAVRSLKAAGIAVVVAAGNEGPGCSSVGDAPGSYSGEVLSVGSFNHWDNTVSSFSSRGPSVWNGGLAPDLVAPGHLVRSSIPRWENSSNPYDYKAGTSMASPHVAGAIALLWSAQPNLVGQVDRTFELVRKSSVGKRASQTCGNFLGQEIPNAVFGHGLLDAYQLIQQSKED